MVNRNDASVQTYLSMLQDVINRLAGNSAAAKGWCAALVSAILVFVIDKGRSQAALVAFVPVFLFFVLDAYYLSLERDMRAVYNHYVERLGKGELPDDEVFVIRPSSGTWHRIVAIINAVFSFSVWFFYLLVVVALISVWRITL